MRENSDAEALLTPGQMEGYPLALALRLLQLPNMSAEALQTYASEVPVPTSLFRFEQPWGERSLRLDQLVAERYASTIAVKMSRTDAQRARIREQIAVLSANARETANAELAPFERRPFTMIVSAYTGRRQTLVQWVERDLERELTQRAFESNTSPTFARALTTARQRRVIRNAAKQTERLISEFISRYGGRKGSDAKLVLGDVASMMAKQWQQAQALAPPERLRVRNEVGADLLSIGSCVVFGMVIAVGSAFVARVSAEEKELITQLRQGARRAIPSSDDRRI